MTIKHAKITIGTHFFKVTCFDDKVRYLLYEYLKKFVKYGLEKIPRTNRYRKVPTAVFATRTVDKNEFRFHINQYEDFKKFLAYNLIAEGALDIETLTVPVSDELNCKMRSNWEPRDDQIPIIEYLTKGKYRSKLVGIQTGKGKGYVSNYAATILNKRIAVVVRPMFIYKWVEDITKYLDIDPSKEIMVVQGLTQLMGVLEAQSQNLLSEVKVFIFSNKTLQLWYKQYQEHRQAITDLGYKVPPEELFGHLKVGLRIIDEVHLDFHLNYKIDLYTNVEHSISLSATLDNKDDFLRQMYELAYPLYTRYEGGEIDKYTVARCFIYSIDDKPDKIRSTEYGSKSYSHNAFEEYIMRRPNKLQNYLRLIKHALVAGFIEDYKPGQRCVIFAYRKDFCTVIVDYLKKQYPNLDIRRYVAEDPDENMYEPDIRVTTLGSGSTGHDIANLKTAILTVNVESLQSNIQAFGRLRKIEGLTTRFFYFTCLDIPKHMQYHKAKMELMKKRALNFNIYQSPFRI